MRVKRTTPPTVVPNPEDPSGETVLLPLTQGKFSIIDAADAERVTQFFWCAHNCHGRWYVTGRVHNDGGWSRLILLHRFILKEYDPKVLIDHADTDALHNSRKNLRKATKAQNAANSNLRSDNKSGFRGVSWDGRRKKWRATFRPQGKQVWLGYYDCPKEAAAAYDKEVTQHFGEFAMTNARLGLLGRG